MIIFFYLIFAHLLADFVLQPTTLVQWKQKSWKGTAFHSLIHLLIYMAVLPMLGLENLQVALIFLGLAVSHFLIDSVKIYKEKHGKNFVLYFIVDQLAHLGVIGLASAWIPTFCCLAAPPNGWGDYMYGHIEVPIGLTLLIFFTSFVEILKCQYLRQKNPEKRFTPDCCQMIYRAAIFTIIYSLFLIMGVYHAAALGMWFIDHYKSGLS